MNGSVDRYRSSERALWRSLGAEPKERFLDLSGPRLRVRVQEVGEGPPALFVHGVMTAGTAFATLVAGVKDLRCVVLDRPGCGLSDPWTPRAELREQVVEMIGAVLDALEIGEVVLAGNSLGAMSATWFALAEPRRVKKLVLLGPSIGFPGVHVPADLRVLSLPRVGELLLGSQRPSREGLVRLFRSLGHARTIERGAISDEMFDWGVSMGAETRTQKNELGMLRRVVGLGGARRVAKLTEAELRSLSMPTLIVAGDTDPHGGTGLARRLGELVPHAQVETLRGVGHLPWLDEPSAVAAAITRFAAETAGACDGGRRAPVT
jgi:2-hydroxy-6-oxonona-2,4-dienedioate hydrolase